MNNVPVHFTVVLNLVLALIPFVLAFYLFKVSHHRNFLWWLLSLVFMAFLPNSAYVLTDIIHFVAAVKSPDISTNYLLFVLVPFYTAFLFVSFEFYVISIQWADEYLVQFKNKLLSLLFVPSVHFLAAIGVYFGRFQRLESTDIIQRPIIVFRDLWLDLTGGSSLLIILGLFVLFYALYEVFSRLNNFISAKVKMRLMDNRNVLSST